MTAGKIALTSGMRTNLYTLQKTGKAMDTTQKRLATGLRVNTATDDPINFFASLSHNQRASALLGRKDEMTEAIRTIETANTGIDNITKLIASGKSLTHTALTTNDATERTVLAQQYAEVLTQINMVVNDANYKGVNLLAGPEQTLEVNFDESGDSNLVITGFAADAFSLGLGEAAETVSTPVSSDFTDLDPDGAGVGTDIGTISDGYLGLNWSNMSWEDGAARWGTDSGYAIGNVSGENVIFNTNGTPASVSVGSGTFDFQSAYLTAAFTDGLQVTVTGSADGQELYNQTITLRNDQATRFDFNFTGIDTLTFNVSNDWFAMDDFNFAINDPPDSSASVATPDWSDSATIAGDQEALNDAMTTLRTQAESFTSKLSIITIRDSFTQGIVNTLKDGAANLVNADMNEEGANMLMLQTRQTLATNALNISSQASQAVLRFF